MQLIQTYLKQMPSPLKRSKTCALVVDAVDPVLLETDAFSTQMLQAYNSINVHVHVSIDNKANQPDLGNVARTNHNRLTSRSVADGFNVVSLALQAFLLHCILVALQVCHFLLHCIAVLLHCIAFLLHCKCACSYCIALHSCCIASVLVLNASNCKRACSDLDFNLSLRTLHLKALLQYFNLDCLLTSRIDAYAFNVASHCKHSCSGCHSFSAF